MSDHYDIVSALSTILIRSKLLEDHVFNDYRPLPDSDLTSAYPLGIFEIVGSRSIPKGFVVTPGDSTKVPFYWYESTIQLTLVALKKCTSRRTLIELERAIRQGLIRFMGCIHHLYVISVVANQPIPNFDQQGVFLRYTTDYQVTFYERTVNNGKSKACC